jgi:alginate O-acetyltransferase complex protein AlgI
VVEFGSLIFWLTAVVLILAVRLLPLSGARRRWLFLAAAAILLAGSPAGAVALLGVSLYGHVAMRTAQSQRLLVVHLVVLTAMLYFGISGADVAPSFASILPVVGLPYVYLRVIHLVLETRANRLPTFGIAEYLTYLLPFHQFFAGPIERFSEFRENFQDELPPLTNTSTLDALDRLTNGLIKYYVLAGVLSSSFAFEFNGSGLSLWLEVGLQAIHVYLNFSGYMDIVIGLGMLMGWRPPENFNWPYFSRNILVFWTRWHMTLSNWIRDYIFIPLNIHLQREYRLAPLLAGAISYLVSMIFCGFWHRPTVSFALWGAIHGGAIIVCKLYEWALKRMLSRSARKSYQASRIAAVASGFVTFQFVAISLVFAFNDFGDALIIVGRMFGSGL